MNNKWCLRLCVCKRECVYVCVGRGEGELFNPLNDELTPEVALWVRCGPFSYHHCHHLNVLVGWFLRLSLSEMTGVFHRILWLVFFFCCCYCCSCCCRSFQLITDSCDSVRLELKFSNVVKDAFGILLIDVSGEERGRGDNRRFFEILQGIFMGHLV